jgi:hypothetical protein
MSADPTIVGAIAGGALVLGYGVGIVAEAYYRAKDRLHDEDVRAAIDRDIRRSREAELLRESVPDPTQDRHSAY